MMNLFSVFYLGQNPKTISKTVGVLLGISFVVLCSCSLSREDQRPPKLQPDTEKEAFLFEDKLFYPAVYKPNRTIRGLSYVTNRDENEFIINFGNKDLYGKLEMYNPALKPNQKLKIKISGGTARFTTKELESLINSKELSNHVFTVSFKVYDVNNQFISAGKQSFTTQPEVAPVNTIMYGPEVVTQTTKRITLAYETQTPCSTIVWHNGVSHTVDPETQNHRISIERLSPDSAAKLIIEVNGRQFAYVIQPLEKEFETLKFLFTANTSTGGKNGSDQNFYESLFQRAKTSGAGFIVFGGNFSNGPFEDAGEARTEWNFHRFYRDQTDFMKPVYTMPGKKEYITTSYLTEDKSVIYKVNKSPVYTASTEAVFSRVFETPVTRLAAERDLKPLFNGNAPHPEYGSTAFAFEHRTLGVIVLNTEYARTENKEFAGVAGGGISGYIANNQMSWFKRKLSEFENNPEINHIAVCMHSPLFPVSTYAKSAFWYNGDVNAAPKNAKNQLLPGVVEVRNEVVKALNTHTKVKVVLSAEPGYSGSQVFSKNSALYPQDYEGEKVVLRSDLLFVNCGGMHRTRNLADVPWAKDVEIEKNAATGLLLEFTKSGGLNTEFLR